MGDPDPGDDEEPTFDALLGTVLLIGISYFDADETLLREEQHHGRVVATSASEGIVIRRADGTSFALPPDLGNIYRAEPGAYHLRGTGEVVQNPDFVTTYQVFAGGQPDEV